jgi:hypothetical protein
VRTHSAKEAVDDLSRKLADVLSLMASGIAEGSARDRAEHWLSRARELGREIERVDRALAEAEDSARLNPRTLGLPSATPPLRGGLEMLEHASVIIRGLARCIADGSRLHGDQSTARQADTREILADALRQFAAALRAHGRLVWTEGDSDHLLAEAGLESQLAEADRAWDRLNAAFLAAPAADPDLWPLRGELLVHLNRLRQELEVEDLGDDGKDVHWRSRRVGAARQSRIPGVASSVRPVAEKVRPVASRVRRGRPAGPVAESGSRLLPRAPAPRAGESQAAESPAAASLVTESLAAESLAAECLAAEPRPAESVPAEARAA